jgi:hypothetical protein
MDTGDAEEVLATTLPFSKLSGEEARLILEYCKVVPAEFFGGAMAEWLCIMFGESRRETNEIAATNLEAESGLTLADMLKRHGLYQTKLPVIDFAALKSLDEFKSLASLPDLILAVDWATGDMQIVFGVEKLRSGPERIEAWPVAFAVDFATGMLEVLLDFVRKTKGHFYYNGKRHERLPK